MLLLITNRASLFISWTVKASTVVKNTKIVTALHIGRKVGCVKPNVDVNPVKMHPLLLLAVLTLFVTRVQMKT